MAVHIKIVMIQAIARKVLSQPERYSEDLLHAAKDIADKDYAQRWDGLNTFETGSSFWGSFTRLLPVEDWPALLDGDE
jgi:hypothetical protein